MDEVQYHSDVTRVYHTNYVRNSRAVAVLWGIFTVCYALLNIVVFIQPQWIGDTVDSPEVGFFGLYQHCERAQFGADYTCQGSFTDFSTILNDSFRAAAFFVGLSALIFLICTLCLLLFFFLNTATVLKICAWMQTMSALFMFLACVVYANGWDQDEVRRICGQNADKFKMDHCGIRWAYILAIILIFDAIILAVLAFVLAHKQAKLLPEIYGKHPKYVNEFSVADTMSKRSHLPSHLMVSDDRFSEYSHRSDKRSQISSRPAADNYQL